MAPTAPNVPAMSHPVSALNCGCERSDEALGRAAAQNLQLHIGSRLTPWRR